MREEPHAKGFVLTRMGLSALLLTTLPSFAWAQLTLLPQESPPAVFAGRPQHVEVRFHNPTDQAIETKLETHLFQVSSATAMPVGDAQPWKTLTVLSGQTVLERLPVTVPEIRAPAQFEIRLGDLGRVLLAAYPVDLLKRLETLAGDQPLGVYDPDNQLKPALQAAKVGFVDLESESARCHLELVWQTTSGPVPERIREHLDKGAAVVWLRPSKTSVARIVRVGMGTVVIAPLIHVTGLADAARAQLNLIHFAELALQPNLVLTPDQRTDP